MLTLNRSIVITFVPIVAITLIVTGIVLLKLTNNSIENQSAALLRNNSAELQQHMDSSLGTYKNLLDNQLAQINFLADTLAGTDEFQNRIIRSEVETLIHELNLLVESNELDFATIIEPDNSILASYPQSLNEFQLKRNYLDTGLAAFVTDSGKGEEFLMEKSGLLVLPAHMLVNLGIPSTLIDQEDWIGMVTVRRIENDFGDYLGILVLAKALGQWQKALSQVTEVTGGAFSVYLGVSPQISQGFTGAVPPLQMDDRNSRLLASRSVWVQSVANKPYYFLCDPLQGFADNLLGHYCSAISIEKANHTQVEIESLAEQLVSDLRNWLLILGSITLLVFTLMSMSLAKRIARPLMLLTNRVENFDPELDQPLVPESVKFSKNEIGKLAQSFNEMSRQIQKNNKLRDDFIQQLEQQNSELERFTYTVSHDLKSPLVTIKGFLGLLKRDIKEANQDRIESDMQQMVSAADQMGSLLDDLLELSRVGSVPNTAEIFSLSALCDDVAGLLHGAIQKNSASVDIAANMPNVYADRKRVFEVVQNLIENAIKFSGNKSAEIFISATKTEDHVLCRVSDLGIGIDSRYLEKVFGLFDRLETDTAGTGIGLSLVKRIIEINHGTVWIESDGEDKGTQVCFTLPSCKEDIDEEKNER